MNILHNIYKTFCRSEKINSIKFVLLFQWINFQPYFKHYNLKKDNLYNIFSSIILIMIN